MTTNNPTLSTQSNKICKSLCLFEWETQAHHSCNLSYPFPFVIYSSPPTHKIHITTYPLEHALAFTNIVYKPPQDRHHQQHKVYVGTSRYCNAQTTQQSLPPPHPYYTLCLWYFVARANRLVQLNIRTTFGRWLGCKMYQ